MRSPSPTKIACRLLPRTIACTGQPGSCRRGRRAMGPACPQPGRDAAQNPKWCLTPFDPQGGFQMVSDPIYSVGMAPLLRVLAALVLPLVAGCAVLDPHNVVGRQFEGATQSATPDGVFGPATTALDTSARERAFEFVWN